MKAITIFFPIVSSIFLGLEFETSCNLMNRLHAFLGTWHVSMLSYSLYTTFLCDMIQLKYLNCLDIMIYIAYTQNIFLLELIIIYYIHVYE